MASSQASFPFTLLLGVLVALTALGMDMFLPAVPVIAHALGAEPGDAQQTVTAYLLGLAIGQLAWGPVSDRYGHKPVLLAGRGFRRRHPADGACDSGFRTFCFSFRKVLL